MFGQPFEVSSHAKKKNAYKYIPAKNFRGTPQNVFDLRPWDFYVWENLKSLAYSAAIENEQTLHQRIFLCLSNHSQLPWNIWKGATLRDQC
jgi:hypothetical protein